MRGAILRAPGQIGIDELPDPRIEEPTDALLRVVASGVSNLWTYRGDNGFDGPRRMGHEYVGIVEELGQDVTTLRRGDLVVGSFIASDGTCRSCRTGLQAACQRGVWISDLGAAAEWLRVPWADGTLVATPEPEVDPARLRSLVAASDVLGTAWYAAASAQIRPGASVAIVGEGSVGLSAILAARDRDAGQIIIASRHPQRSALARSFGASEVIAERGAEAIARVRDLTGGGADVVIEAVGRQESLTQAIGSARPGGTVVYVGVPHEVTLNGRELFDAQVRLIGGTASVRPFLPNLIQQIWTGRMDPGRVFDVTLPLDEIAAGYRAMEERRAIKVMLLP